jgi:hypothetical protein
MNNHKSDQHFHRQQVPEILVFMREIIVIIEEILF